MNQELLWKHINVFVSEAKSPSNKFASDVIERDSLSKFYQAYSKDRILQMSNEDIYEYLSKLWAMLIWGNKHYVIDKLIDARGIDNFREHLAELVWGHGDIGERWDFFRKEIKGMGPAMISEILCKSHPGEFMVWNRRAFVALNYLRVEKLPKRDYQITGSTYKYLCGIAKIIASELDKAGYPEPTLLTVDYFIWDQLQVQENLTNIYAPKHEKPPNREVPDFDHDEIRDKLRDIGQWLGFTAKTEQKVSKGAVVDTIWESTIGNMGRVIYLFEVQSRGSVDSLMLNLLKSLKNPAVQGIVAVSDKGQIDSIKSHAEDVKELREKLRYWDYAEVLAVHESLEFVNTTINNLGLVPEGF